MEIVSDPTEEGFNSLVSLEDAQAYFDGSYFPEGSRAWDDLDPDDQARLLVTASRRLSGLPWTGAPLDAAQPLAFPRSYSSGEYGTFAPEGGTEDAEVPAWAVALVCETARWVWEEASRTLSDSDLGLLTSFKAGDLAVTFAKGGASASLLGARAAAILEGLSPEYVLLGTGPRSLRMIL